MNKYDLEGRTLKFSLDLVKALKDIPKSSYNQSSISQCIRSGTSVGANYREANGAESKKDFLHKIRIAYKEARETEYWLQIISMSEQCNGDLADLLSEANQLIRIFATSIKTCNQNKT